MAAVAVKAAARDSGPVLLLLPVTSPTVKQSYQARHGDQIFFSLLLCWFLFNYLFACFFFLGGETGSFNM